MKCISIQTTLSSFSTTYPASKKNIHNSVWILLVNAWVEKKIHMSSLSHTHLNFSFSRSHSRWFVHVFCKYFDWVSDILKTNIFQSARFPWFCDYIQIATQQKWDWESLTQHIFTSTSTSTHSGISFCAYQQISTIRRREPPALISIKLFFFDWMKCSSLLYPDIGIMYGLNQLLCESFALD